MRRLSRSKTPVAIARPRDMPSLHHESRIERCTGTGTAASAEEHRDVAADVVQAIVTGVDVLVIAEAGQRDEDDDEAGLHDEPGEGHGQG